MFVVITPGLMGVPRWPELKAPRCVRWPGAAADPAAGRRSDERLQGCRPDDQRVPQGQRLARRPGL